MSGTVNKVIIIGNVAKDPEIRYLQEGKEIANIVVATSESWKDKISGERKEKTEWHKISVYNEALVNIVRTYIKKGAKIYVQGSIQTKKWTDEQNIARYSTEIAVQGYSGMIVMLSNKSDNTSGPSDQKSYDSSSAHDEYKSYNNMGDDDDVPF